jgi:hypothetical protein
MMQNKPVAVCRETVPYENFLLEYTLLRSDPDDAALCPVYGIACTAHCGGNSVGAYRHTALTDNMQDAHRLFRMLTANAVFPNHMDDVIHDLRELWTAPEHHTA